jgi:hypothetical protein
MQTYHVAATVADDRTLVLTGLPFGAGQQVEVTVSLRPSGQGANDRYPLRGMIVSDIDPTESVAEGDWEALK